MTNKLRNLINKVRNPLTPEEFDKHAEELSGRELGEILYNNYRNLRVREAAGEELVKRWAETKCHGPDLFKLVCEDEDLPERVREAAGEELIYKYAREKSYDDLERIYTRGLESIREYAGKEIVRLKTEDGDPRYLIHFLWRMPEDERFDDLRKMTAENIDKATGIALGHSWK